MATAAAARRHAICVDAMGGDRAPAEILAGAKRAAAELGVEVVLAGRPDAIEAAGGAGELEVLPATEVVGMDEDAAAATRRKKDSSLAVAAAAVRDGRASAMVSAGNTGAAMATALLRMGRIKGVARPAIATPIPIPGRTPTILLDAGANAECRPEWLVQFARMGAVFATTRYGITRPKAALLSIGEESSKGTPLVKETHALLAGGAGGKGLEFVGNVEGRDLMAGAADVVVTDGFTGNVVLKTLEGTMRFFLSTLGGVLSSTEEAKAAADTLLPLLMPVAAELDPEATGGAMLLGVDGVCIISHGSSSATAIVNAVRVGHELVEHGLVEAIGRAVGE